MSEGLVHKQSQIWIEAIVPDKGLLYGFLIAISEFSTSNQNFSRKPFLQIWAKHSLPPLFFINFFKLF